MSNDNVRPAELTAEDRIRILEYLHQYDPSIDYSSASNDDLNAFREFIQAGPAPEASDEQSSELQEIGEDDPPEGVFPIVEEEEDEEEDSESDVPEPTNAELVSMLSNLRDQLESLKSNRTSSTRVASGSRPRANVKYLLLNKPPKWHKTPQVAQIEQILFSKEVADKFTSVVDGKPTVSISEPDLVEIIRKGAEDGTLRTQQEPFRIFQYYRKDLISASVIRMI